MRIFITGVTGFVGRNLAAYWSQMPELELAGCGRAALKNEHLPETLQYFPLELTQREAVLAAITAFRPDIVIHSAAMSKPNDCEVQRDLCYDVNVNATRYVVEACLQCNSRLLFMSTDFVFGDNGPFREDDVYGPLNYYGESKMLAEQIVQQSALDWSIVRTVLVYGKQLPGLHATFPQWVKGQLDQGKTIRVFTDQYRTATYVLDLVKGIDAMVRKPASGIYHISGAETFSPFDMAQRVAAHFGFDPQRVQPVTRQEWAEPARRPVRALLAIDKAKRDLGYAPVSLDTVMTDLF